MPKGPLTSLPTAPCTGAMEGQSIAPYVPHNPFGNNANSFKPPVADSCTPQTEATKLRPDHIRRSVAWSGLFFCPAHEISPLLHSPSLVGCEGNRERFANVQKEIAVHG